MNLFGGCGLSLIITALLETLQSSEVIIKIWIINPKIRRKKKNPALRKIDRLEVVMICTFACEKAPWNISSIEVFK